METPPSSEGGASRREVSGTGGGTTNANESLHEIPEPPRHELLLLLRVEQPDGRPLLVGTYTDRCVNLPDFAMDGVESQPHDAYKSFGYCGGICCRCVGR